MARLFDEAGISNEIRDAQIRFAVLAHAVVLPRPTEEKIGFGYLEPIVRLTHGLEALESVVRSGFTEQETRRRVIAASDPAS